MLFVGHDIETRAIELTLTSTPLPVVMGDRVQLQQVIVNLLVNSIQAIPNAGKIFVETELRPDTTVSLTIYDNGPGIPEEDIDRVFEGFFTTKDEGIGVGLAICQSIITAHRSEEHTSELQSLMRISY